MGLLNFSAAPIDPNEKINNPKKKGRPKGKTTKQRYVDPDAQTYGDELFKSAHRPEATIVLKFHPLDSSYLRVETTGNYAIKYFEEKDEFVLYGFLSPLENFEWIYHPPFEIIESSIEICKTFHHLVLDKDQANGKLFVCIKCNNRTLKYNKQKDLGICSDCQIEVPLDKFILKEALMVIIKKKYLEAKEQRKIEKLAFEKLVQESQEKTDELRESLDEQLVTAGISDYQPISEREDKTETKEDKEKSEILLQKEQETNGKKAEPSEIRETGNKIVRKIVGFNSDGSLIYE